MALMRKRKMMRLKEEEIVMILTQGFMTVEWGGG